MEVNLPALMEVLSGVENTVKELLHTTPDTISIGDKNNQDHISDALESIQSATRSLLKLQYYDK